MFSSIQFLGEQILFQRCSLVRWPQKFPKGPQIRQKVQSQKLKIKDNVKMAYDERRIEHFNIVVHFHSYSTLEMSMFSKSSSKKDDTYFWDGLCRM